MSAAYTRFGDPALNRRGSRSPGGEALEHHVRSASDDGKAVDVGLAHATRHVFPPIRTPRSRSLAQILGVAKKAAAFQDVPSLGEDPVLSLRSRRSSSRSEVVRPGCRASSTSIRLTKCLGGGDELGGDLTL